MGRLQPSPSSLPSPPITAPRRASAAAAASAGHALASGRGVVAGSGATAPLPHPPPPPPPHRPHRHLAGGRGLGGQAQCPAHPPLVVRPGRGRATPTPAITPRNSHANSPSPTTPSSHSPSSQPRRRPQRPHFDPGARRSEEHTSE